MANTMDGYQKVFDARGHLYNDAMSDSPGARDRERASLLALVSLRPGQSIMDAPAGGGFVADGVHALSGGRAALFCVEPSQRFSAPIGDRYPVLNCPLQAVPLPDHSIDVILSLAGLHHIGDRAPVYREWARLLPPGGQLAVADVADGTGTARFLNGFVNRHTPGGHDGVFISESEFSKGMAEAGLRVAEDQLKDVPWQFPDHSVLGRFCQTLFGITRASADEVAAALERDVGVDLQPGGGVLLRWQLRYALAHRDS